MSGNGNVVKARRLLPALGFGLLALGICSPPAQAAFGNCNDPGYLTRFDSQLAALSDVHCRVVGTPTALATSSGTVHIRIVKLADESYPSESETIDAVRNALDSVTRAATRLGPFAMDDTTILVGDTDPPGALSESFGTYAATANWTETHGPDGECDITLWRVGTDGSPDQAGPVVAHELFHCIEAATLSRAQMATYGAPGSGDPNARWWAEGAADWFSALALPAQEYMHELVGRFDRQSPDTPLYQMSDDAVVFFDWLGQNYGGRAVVPFLHHMAARSGATAQRAAMAGALHAVQWLQFAKDYLDGTIVDGHGTPIHSEPKEGGEWEWEEPGTRRVALPPFVLKREHIKLDKCDDWRLSLDPLPLPVAESIRLDERDHSDWQVGSVTARGKYRYVFVGMNTKSKALNLSVIAEKLTDHCEVEQEKPEPIEGGHGQGYTTVVSSGSRPVPATTIPATQTRTRRAPGNIDRCLVGEWDLVSGGNIGLAKVLSAETPRATFSKQGTKPSLLILKPDGTFMRDENLSISYTYTAENPDNSLKAESNQHEKSTGTWSAKDGRLTLRPMVSQLGAGRAKLVQEERASHLALRGRTSHDLPAWEYAYTCTADALKLTAPNGVEASILADSGQFPMIYRKADTGQDH